MPMEGQVKFFSSQNTAGVWQAKGAAVEGNGNHESDVWIIPSKKPFNTGLALWIIRFLGGELEKQQV